jgi:hypothetical protein
LDQLKRHDDFIFAKLSLQVDLLLCLAHPDGSENLLRGWRGLGRGKRSQGESEDEAT